MDIFRSRMGNELFKLIKDDHERIESASQQIEKAGESDRGYLYSNLKRQLIPHMKAEEKVVYPVLRNNLRTHEGALLSMEEHRIAESLMKELDKMPVEDETWKAKFTALAEVVTNHIKKEESNVFSESSKAIPEEELNNMASSFQREKEKVTSSIS